MIISGVSRALQFLMLLLTLRVATTFLSPAEMGKLAVVTATVSFFALFLLNPVGMFINRRMHAWDVKGQVRGYLKFYWVYVAAVAAFAMLLMLLLLGSGLWQSSVPTEAYLLLVGGSIIFGTLNQLTIPSLNLLGNRVWFAVLTVATTVASLAFALAAIWFLERRAEFWMMGLLLGQLLIGLIALQVFHKKLQVAGPEGNAQPSFNNQKIRGLLAFTWPIALSVSLGWIQSQSYRFVVEQQLGLHELGLFATGFGIAAGITAGFESVVSTYFQPIFYKSVNAERENSAEDAWREYAKSVLPSVTLTAFLIFALAPELTRLLLGAAYQDSSRYVMWGAIAEWARIATAVFALFAHARMKTRMLIYPNLLGALLALSLVWGLITLYGAAGIGPALVLSATGAFVLTLWITRRMVAVHISPKKVALLLAMGALLLLVARSPYVFFDGALGLFATVVFTVLTGTLFCGFQLVFLYRFIRPST